MNKKQAKKIEKWICGNVTQDSSCTLSMDAPKRKLIVVPTGTKLKFKKLKSVIAKAMVS